MSPATLLAVRNDLGRKHGIGRLALVENRFVRMKSRGMYETPGGTIYTCAHRGIAQLTLDRAAAHLKDELEGRNAELVYKTPVEHTPELQSHMNITNAPS